MNIFQRLEALEKQHGQSDLCVVTFRSGGKRRMRLPDVIDLQPVSVSMVNGKEQPLYRLIVGMIEE